MAEVNGIVSDLITAGQRIEIFAHQTNKWRYSSNRLLDLRESIDAVQISLQSWERKYDVQKRRPIIYLQVLFGRLGCERVQAILRDIQVVTGTIQRDITRIVSHALRARPGHSPLGERVDTWLVEDCLTKIRRKPSWSQKFVLSVLGRSEDLEMHLECLHRKLTTLERSSDYYLEKEHSVIFSDIMRLPGRTVVLKTGDRRSGSVQIKLLDALSAQKDAELLHKASDEGNRVHIGLSVPQIREQDFAFLLSLGGTTHEVLVHPVKIKAINGSTRVQSNLAAAVPSLMQAQDKYDVCYVKPSSHSSNGFELSIPPTNLLSDLEYKASLSSIFSERNTRIGAQILYPQDQCAIASGIAQSSFRLLGSQWLESLDSNNVRWRRTASGEHTVMLTPTRGKPPTTRALETYLAANKPHRDLSKHVHIFRIGIVLAELCLKTSFPRIAFHAPTNTVKLFLNDNEEVHAIELAAEVERKSNVYVGNIVFFCLSVLQRQDRLDDTRIESAYLTEVVNEAERLDDAVKKGRKWEVRSAGSSAGGSLRGSGVSTPSYRY
ncbi:hypothetical protein EKO04_000809 [Ascochyta lentis]|uniref:Uncharacterized protein n=1 Tax=Ascochyta lentis TaxID=205686 RepID=A0A8H7JAE1_9PLEO|nr:hypothetical protein EKO04_000809 [Ascochyta lentis]